MNHAAYHAVLLLLACSVVAVALFRRFQLPPILAYLTVGALVGPHGLGVIADSEDIRFLAEFGVVFLMFSIGLEFSLPQLIALRREVFGLGGVQVAATAGLAGGIALAVGLSPAAAFAVGGVAAMSSTAIVSKQLAEQLELRSRHGRQAIAILLFQDLAVIPFLLLIPILGNGGGGAMWGTLGWMMFKGTLVFATVLAAGHWLLRPLLHWVAAGRSSELFMLTVLLVALGAAWATHAAGLSLALGAFLAGMMLSETEYRHQLEADIRPFQDVLLGLFFVTVGMLLDLGALPAIWPWVALLLGTMLLLKSALIMGVVVLFRSEPGVALRTGLTLGHVGEFGFVLVSLAIASGVLAPGHAQPLLTAAVLSMTLAPLMARYSYAAAKTLCRRSYLGGFERMADEIAADAHDLSGHVIICGYGHFGQNVARVLELEGIRYLALDQDPQRVREARAAGEPVHYGDATRGQILAAAGLAQAAAVVVGYRTPATVLGILDPVRRTRPEIPVLVRAREMADLEKFRDHGATEVFPEVLETSLMLSTHLLRRLGLSAKEIRELVRQARDDQYRLLRGAYLGTQPLPLDQVDAVVEQLHPVPLPEGAHAVGRELREIHLEELAVTVSAVRRGGIRGPAPEPETRLLAGDVLILYGAPERLEQAEGRLLRG